MAHSASLHTQPGTAESGSRSAPKSDYFAVTVPATALWRTAPLLAARDDVVFRSGFGRHLWGWYIEPHPDGGVIVVATDGRVIGILREPEGRADRGCFILASEGLLKAVAPPPMLTGYMEGDTVEVPARAIEVPGLVFASSVGCFIQHSGDYPDEDADDQTNAFNLYAEMAEYGNTWAGGYRLIESGHGWRKIVEAFVQPEAATPYLDPALLAAFSRVQEGGWIIYTQADREAVYQVRHPEAADFVGYIMPCRWPSTPPSSLPGWLDSIKATPPPPNPARWVSPQAMNPKPPQPPERRMPVSDALNATPLEAAYGCLWILVTDDKALHAARRHIGELIGRDGKIRGVKWASVNLPPPTDAEIRSIEI